MATKKKAGPEGLRRCIGSVKFGIEAHDAEVRDFPSQPSQKDGLGRMCRTDWSRYTAALRQAAADRQAAPASVAAVERAHADKAEARVKKAGKPEPKGKLAPTSKRVAMSGTSPAGKPSPRPVEPEPTVAAAGTADPEAAEQDAILVERRQRVKAWRRSELEGTATEA